MAKVLKSSIEGVYYFWCPGCSCAHWFSTTGLTPNSPQGDKGPVWTFNNNFDKPTVRASILVVGEFRCHLFITDGNIEFLSDCTHLLKGKTIGLCDF